MLKELTELYACPYTHAKLSQDGASLKSPSGRSFAVENGIPVFLDAAKLGTLEKKTQTEYDLVADEFYDNAVDWLFESFYEEEDKVRNGMVDLLDLKPRSRVLEIGCGTGRDSFRIAQRLGKGGVFFLQDLSRNMVLKTQKTMEAYGQKNSLECGTHYFISDGLHLPFPERSFDAVFHFGGFNNFSHPKESLKEFTRITKIGGKIVVGDESVPPWLKGTEFAEIVCVNNPLFRHRAPLRAIPEGARNVTVRWVLGGCFYLIDFSVDEGTPRLNLDLPHKGRRGGTMRTRYYGQLEGVSLAAKKKAQAAAAKQGLSLHEWLDRLIRKEAKSR